MAGNESLPSARVTVRRGGTRVTMSLADYRARSSPAAAPRGDDVLRREPGSVELIMCKAGQSRKDLLAEVATDLRSALFAMVVAGMLAFTIALVLAVVVVPDPSLGGTFTGAAVAAAPAALLCFAVWLVGLLPGALRIRFAPAVSPAEVRVTHCWRSRRIPLSALSGITVVEFRYRPPGQVAAGDTRRETASTLPYRIDAVLHRAGGGSWTVRGKGSPAGWRPDTRDVYQLLADLLATAGVAVDRQVNWVKPPAPRSQLFSPGSGGANGLGGG